VVETSTHSVIRSMEEPTVENRVVSRGTPVDDFSAGPCRSELASDRGMHAQSDRRKQSDMKGFECSIQVTPLVVVDWSEYK
jgi:hypothetical protein